MPHYWHLSYLLLFFLYMMVIPLASCYDPVLLDVRFLMVVLVLVLGLLWKECNEMM